MSDVVIRDAVESDIPFVFSAWLKSYARSRSVSVSIDDYYRGHHGIIARLLGHAKTMIAAPTDAKDVVVGFCCCEPQIVHYMYIKNVYRAKYFPEEGVATALLSACVDVSKPFVITHKTDAGYKFLRKHKLSTTYNPYPAYLAGYVDTYNNKKE